MAGRREAVDGRWSWVLDWKLRVVGGDGVPALNRKRDYRLFASVFYADRII